jgi:hypothetical protein
MPQVLEKVPMQLGQQKMQLKLSVNSTVGNPTATLETLNPGKSLFLEHAGVFTMWTDIIH